VHCRIAIDLRSGGSQLGVDGLAEPNAEEL
jgi:hypothetical protein